jgi:Ca2+-binding RTX toxin-like protein
MTIQKIIGTQKADSLISNTTTDLTFFLAHPEFADPHIFHGGGGNDTIYGNLGDSTIYGGKGDDLIIADYYKSDENYMRVNGHSYHNNINAGAGNDRIELGVFDSTVVGGAGRDLFNFNFKNGVSDSVIRDFNVQDDTLRIDFHGQTVKSHGDMDAPWLRAVSSGEDTALTITDGTYTHTIQLVGINADEWQQMQIG